MKKWFSFGFFSLGFFFCPPALSGHSSPSNAFPRWSSSPLPSPLSHWLQKRNKERRGAGSAAPAGPPQSFWAAEAPLGADCPDSTAGVYLPSRSSRAWLRRSLSGSMLSSGSGSRSSVVREEKDRIISLHRENKQKEYSKGKKIVNLSRAPLPSSLDSFSSLRSDKGRLMIAAG